MNDIRDTAAADDAFGATMTMGDAKHDTTKITGRFSAELVRDGVVIDRFEWDNLITTVGKNFLLDQALAGSAYTAAEYMGLISSASFTAVAAGDTMSSHAGWLEAGVANAPTFAARLAVSWSAAASGVKALSAAASFTFTGSGTVQGAFLTGGSGASATIANTGGTLYSAGTISPTRAVISGDVLNVSYSSTLT